MKFISWNVNGLRACDGKGFRESFAKLDADFFCLQETKMQPHQLDMEFEGYRSYWNSAEKKGYSGTAVFTRHEPLNVVCGLGIDEHDHEGRVITLEMENFYLVTVYTPNSQDGLRRLDYRMTWDDFPAYYEVGVVKQLIMADDIELSDGAADFEADPVIAKGDRAVCDAMRNEEDIYGWNAGNTTVTIQNGEITRVDRIWVP